MQYVHQGQRYVPGYVSDDLTRWASIRHTHPGVRNALALDSRLSLPIRTGRFPALDIVNIVTCISYVEYSQFRASVEVIFSPLDIA